ncbi:MAG: hypothetical protein AAF547_02205 [Actinomycetota bacterium]
MTTLQQRIAPVNLAEEERLPVPDALVDLFPLAGLQRGWSVGFSGHGGWSVALAMLGAAVGSDGWAAGVGLEELSLVAGEELGLQLDRVLMVESPERGADGSVPSVIASLIEVVDVVCLGRVGPIGIRDARRLMARAREQDAVLFHLSPGTGPGDRTGWPHPMDVTLHAEVGEWSGIGGGHGHLTTRTLTVTTSGRRSMAKPRRVEVLLPGPDGVPIPAPDASVADPRQEKVEVGVWPVSA